MKNNKNVNEKNEMKIIQIITLAISLFMLYLTIGIYLNSGVDAKYGASQSDIEYAFTFSKFLLAYIILVSFVLTMTLIQKKKKI